VLLQTAFHQNEHEISFSQDGLEILMKEEEKSDILF
jgi:hypothetical protein